VKSEVQIGAFRARPTFDSLHQSWLGLLNWAVSSLSCWHRGSNHNKNNYRH